MKGSFSLSLSSDRHFLLRPSLFFSFLKEEALSLVFLNGKVLVYEFHYFVFLFLVTFVYVQELFSSKSTIELLS